MSKEVVREPKLLNVLVFSDTSNASLCHEQYLLKPRYKTRYMYLFLDNAIYLSKTCVPTSHEARYPIQENFSGGKKKIKKILLPFHQRPGFISCKQLKFWATKAPSHLAEITKACFWLTVTGHDLQPLLVFQGFSLFPLSSPKQTQLQIGKILQWNFPLMGLNVCHLCKNTLRKNSTVVG